MMIKPFIQKIFLIAFYITISACSHEKSPIEKSFDRISIPENNINDFSSKIIFDSFTTLETNSESVFKDPTKVLYHNQTYFIYDRALQKILLFEENGKYVGKLDKKGQGPDEYIDLRDFLITQDVLIAILTYDKIMYYDFNFNLVDVYEIGSKNNPDIYLNTTQFYRIDDIFYLWNGTTGIEIYKERMPFLMYLSQNSKIIKGYFPVSYKLIGGNRFSAFNKRVLLTPTLDNDTVYSIVDDTLEVAFIPDFGKFHLPKDYVKEYEDMQKLFNSEYCFGFNNLIETSGYLYFEYTQNKIIMQGLFSKTTGKCVTGMLNPFTKMICAEGDYLIGISDPVLLEQCIKNIDKIKISSDLKNVFTRLTFNINDNPVKIKYSIKPF